jgi:hypothetical protein
MSSSDRHPDNLAERRNQLPLASQVVGQVRSVPRLGHIGIFVDIGLAVPGFVDSEWLPKNSDHWPSVGVSGRFEILQHRRNEVALLSLEGRYRGPKRPRHFRHDDEWGELKTRFPVGSIVDGSFSGTRLVANSEYVVRFDDTWGVVDRGDRSLNQGLHSYVVTAYSDATQRIILQPRVVQSD